MTLQKLSNIRIRHGVAFREKLYDANIDTVTGALAIQVAVPSVISQVAPLLGIVVNPIAGLAVGAALALIPVL